MTKKSAKRTIVGSPLTPALLNELGGLPDKAPPVSKTYRIWTCHGFRESGNHDVGFVTIWGGLSSTGKLDGIGIKQEIVQTDGRVFIVDANIKCLDNRLASPFQWRLHTWFIKPGGGTELDNTETGTIDGNVMRIKTLGRTLTRKVFSQLACDWCLFEVVRGLAFDGKSTLEFDLLEGLTVLKRDHRLSYRGAFSMKIGYEKVTLHRFDQLGSGILPCEYWLDGNHKLLAVTSMNKAYILDEHIEPRDMVEELRKSQ